LVAPFLAQFDRLAVALGVEEELALADQAGPAVDLVQEVIDAEDLLRFVWRLGLLAVAKRRIGDPVLSGIS
jgi:hypothetical protein